MTASELVLPESARELVEKASSKRINPGLQLDKLSCGGDQQAQSRALTSVTECSGDSKMLAELLERRDEALADLAALRFLGRAVGSLTLHLSRSGALENAGIALHPVYGFAWLPGTGLKGLARAWAETVWASAPEQVDRVAAWNKIRAVFGTSPQSDRDKGWVPDGVNPPAEDAVGRIVFHDAWPTTWPRLVRDIVNNHHSKYYQGKGSDGPGDWEDPVPVNFLAVAKDTIFDFALSDRARVRDGLAEQAMDWLRSALAHAGAGAKTNAGYGRIVPVEDDRPQAPKWPLRSEHCLELVTPAFLAGAAQDRSDCELRPATLRGLLRWWWRTMHAAHLCAAELAKLEALVWGDTECGSPVSISLEPKTRDVQPQQFNKREAQTLHKLDEPKGRKKLIQGLQYITYGMDEKSGRELRRRWYLDLGVKWNLVLTARDGFWGKKQSIPAKELMEQAEAALWLLARFGGTGSKSRKGFGSLASIEMHSTRSIEDCMNNARCLREACGLRSVPSVGRSKAPALECCIQTKEIHTRWRNPWYALDKVGAVYQQFIKDQCQKPDRVVFGLPRRGHRLAGKDRYASPVHWSLDRARDGNLLVRLIAFPANDLPSWQKSQHVLQGLASFVDRELRSEAERTRGRGQSVAAPPTSKSRPSTPDLPSVGTQLRVRLQEPTKKSWMVETIDTTMSGHIGNPRDLPSGLKVGSEIDVVVQRSSPTEAIFRHPIEADKAKRRQSADSKPTGPGPGRRGRRKKR